MLRWSWFARYLRLNSYCPHDLLVGHMCFVAKPRDLRQLATIELMTRNLSPGNNFLALSVAKGPSIQP
jgi:hypothetical protein